MKKIILVDCNNLLFRSYYATAYTGNIMKNSKGFPTNALYGFIGMMNKIINEEKPEYMMVAFDIGKNFRLEKYPSYKDGRSKTPDELKQQMPYARKLLDGMGIRYFELEPYEADDIIGTFARMVKEDNSFDATIVSSDKDLIQLVGGGVDIKLLKQKDYIRYDEVSFKEDWGINPINIIDYKAIAGDASDNIPGVKGIGDKGALSLLTKYETLENVYDHIDEITGKVKEKLIDSKADAFMSKEIATIFDEVPLDVSLEDVKYDGKSKPELNSLLEELEFYSFIKKFNVKKEVKPLVVKAIPNRIDQICSYYIELDNDNYHEANIIGASVTDKDGTYYFDPDNISLMIELINNHIIYTYDEKKNINVLNKLGLKLDGVIFDTMLAAYLLEYDTSDDISVLANQYDYELKTYSENKKNKFENMMEDICFKSEFVFKTRDELVKSLKTFDMYDLYEKIEHPLIKVLSSMEINGVNVEKSTLDDMADTIRARLELLERDIYNDAMEDFNIDSPKQLSEILFNKLGLPDKKKGSTDIKVLNNLVDYHPIIKKIIEYRNQKKLLSTYLEGLVKTIYDDGKIHTIFKQGLTRTGRLSSVSPNLQNIPVRDEEGRKIRKAFKARPGYKILSVDYSQIELRILAHISDSKELIKAFNDGEDIHTKVASDIYGVSINEVTKLMRSTAKAVIFGIVYGISGFGLGENLHINPKDAKEFIEKYYHFYPGVKRYMDNIVKEAYDNGFVTTLFNRRRTISELSSTNYMVRQAGERIALNTPIQGTSADIIKLAMINVYNKLIDSKIDALMLVQVHDELIFEVKEDQLDDLIKLVSEEMINVITLKVPLVVSANYGDDWYEAK